MEGACRAPARSKTLTLALLRQVIVGLNRHDESGGRDPSSTEDTQAEDHSLPGQSSQCSTPRGD